jgi:hypothetical protein
MHELSLSEISLTVRTQRFHRHAFICSGISHANVVPFLGIFSSNQFPYACVFESTGKENLPQYLVSNPGTPRLKLVNYPVLFYLRSPILTPCACAISSRKLLGVSTTSTTWELSMVASEAYGCLILNDCSVLIILPDKHTYR